MTCPSELTCCRYADAAMAPEDALAVEGHIAGCSRCRELVDRFAAESQALRAAMQWQSERVEIPTFVPRPTISRPLAWLVWLALGAWAVDAAWMSLVTAGSLPQWLGWLAPDASGIGIGLMVSLVLGLAGDGGGMLSGVMNAVGWIVVLAACVVVAGLVLRYGSSRRHVSPGIAALLSVALLAPAPPADAFEIRRDDDRVIIPAEETVDDTLLIMSEDVLIEGTVTGDLIAMGETVRIRGRVQGNLLSGAESLDVEGSVGGTVFVMGETVMVRAEDIGGNLFAVGESVTVHTDTSIAGNALLMAEDAEMHGAVARDLLTMAESAALLGEVQGDYRSYGETVVLATTARVGGDLTVTVKDAEHLRVAPGAIVEGETNQNAFQDSPEPYLTPEYYLFLLLKLLAAFVTGLVLFQFAPSLGRLQLSDGADVLKVGGMGAVALVATPLLAVAAMITLIGAPLGIAAFLLWVAAIYAAGILVAGLVGRMLLKADSAHALALLTGLAVLFLLMHIPVLGGLIRLITILVGLGLLVQWLRQLWGSRTMPA